MMQIMDRFFDSVGWDVLQAVALLGGLSGLLGLLLGQKHRGWRRILMWGGLGLLTASVILSMLFEDLLPTIGRLPEHRKIPFALSFPGFLAATAAIVYGGMRVIRATFMTLADAASNGGRRSRVPGINRVPASRFFIAWAPGLIWMAGGFALMALSASAYHDNHFPLPWLWRLFGASAA